jgi:hypothetical protein
MCPSRATESNLPPDLLETRITARIARLYADALQAAHVVAREEAERSIREAIYRAALALVAAGIPPPARFLPPRT